MQLTRELTIKSENVYCVSWHPKEPLIFCGLEDGYIKIFNYATHTQTKKFKVCDLPVRTVQFVLRQNWLVTGSDDMQIRVFDYSTLEGVHSFRAHEGYIRCIVVHPTQPYIITCSDDLLIKLWNWDRNWACQQVFEGHNDFVMQIVINPKDTNTFASASLDTTIKLWGISSSFHNFTLEGHEKGVNCVDYYHGRGQPFIISGANDHFVKIWNYRTKTCVRTLEVYSQNVTSLGLHPLLPILFTGSDNGILHWWHTDTFTVTMSLKYGSESIWTISSKHGSNIVALGFSKGAILFKLEREQPAISMDVKGGKIIWAKQWEMQEIKVKDFLPEATEMKDGECIPLTGVAVCSCVIYPNSIAHSPDGQFVVVCNNIQYIIYSAMELHSKAFGPAQQVAWALCSSKYATLENSTVKVFKDFKERKSFRSPNDVDGIFGGCLLGIQSSSSDDFSFYDWEHLELVIRFNFVPRHVLWSKSGGLVCLAIEESYYLLKYNADVVSRARETHGGPLVYDIEDAFEMLEEVDEAVMTGAWVGDCFVYTDASNTIKYNVGGAIVPISERDDKCWGILGYVEDENRLYLNDKELNIVSYSLALSVLQYQSAVMRGDFETADRVLPTVPHEHRARVAHFLDEQGFKQQALEVATEPEHQFELALSLGQLRHAMQFAHRSQRGDEAPSRSAAARWSRLGAAAVVARDYELTKICFQRARDYRSLLLFAVLSGNKELLEDVARTSLHSGNGIVAFIAYYMLRDMDACLQLLISRNELPHAAYFARTLLPAKMDDVAKLLRKTAGFKTCGQSLDDGDQYKHMATVDTDATKFAKFVKHLDFTYQFLLNVTVGPDTSSLIMILADVTEKLLYDR